MLIIYAHPNKDGHCGHILQTVINNLKQNKTEFEIIDLYQLNYDPVLKNSELYTTGKFEIANENKTFQEKIKNNNKFIIIYPIWWQGMPAILKGFIDKVFLSGFAFSYEGSIPQGLLKNKKALIFTTCASPRWFNYIFLQDRALKNITKDILGFCGIKTKAYLIGDARKFDESRKLGIEKKVNTGLKYLL